MWYIIISLICFLIVTLTIPIRINLKYSIRHRKKSENNNVLDDIISKNDSYPNENYMIIYFFYFIPVFKIRLDKKKNSKGNKKNKADKLRKKIIADDIITTIINFLKSFIKYEKTNEFYLNQKDAKVLAKYLKYKLLDFNLGINFYEPILNAYSIAFINAFLNIFICKNINQFNLEKTTYNTYISNEIYNLRLRMIVYISIITIIPLIIKVLIKYLKLKCKIKHDLKINNKLASNAI